MEVTAFPSQCPEKSTAADQNDDNGLPHEWFSATLRGTAQILRDQRIISPLPVCNRCALILHALRRCPAAALKPFRIPSASVRESNSDRCQGGVRALHLCVLFTSAHKARCAPFMDGSSLHDCMEAKEHVLTTHLGQFRFALDSGGTASICVDCVDALHDK